MGMQTENDKSVDPAVLLKLGQWFSPAYPLGAYACSHGLEWAISAGEVASAADLGHWLNDVLCHGAGRNDAILLVHAHGAEKPSDLNEVAELAAALVPSAERRLEAMALGAAFASITSSVWSPKIPPLPYPVAVGVAARLHHLPLDLTVVLYLQAFIANLVSAGVRFVPLGQSAGQKALAGLADTIAEVASEALVCSLDDLGGCVFRADMASMLHETQQSRIFRT